MSNKSKIYFSMACVFALGGGGAFSESLYDSKWHQQGGD